MLLHNNLKMKYLQLHENFIKKLYHKLDGGTVLPKHVEVEINLLIDAFINFFNQIDGFSKYKITKKTFYNTMYEYPVNSIKMDVSKKQFKNWLKPLDLLKVRYEIRRIPPEISMKYFGKLIHQTTEFDIIKIENYFYKIPDYIYMNHEYLTEYFNVILSKHELRGDTNEILLDKIPDFIEDLNIDDFEFFINTKKYNL